MSAPVIYSDFLITHNASLTVLYIYTRPSSLTFELRFTKKILLFVGRHSRLVLFAS